jgi:hypothetical protein
VGDSLTYAEVTKMALEMAELGDASGTPSDASAQEQWFEGYVKQAEEQGLSIVGAAEGKWNEPASREDVAVLVAEIAEKTTGVEIDDYSYDNVFPDVDASDPNAKEMQFMYDMGVFTGSGVDGQMNPDDSINRAEAAKVMNTAVTNIFEAGGVTEDLDDFDQQLTEWEASLEEDEEDVDSNLYNSGEEDAEDTTSQLYNSGEEDTEDVIGPGMGVSLLNILEAIVRSVF